MRARSLRISTVLSLFLASALSAKQTIAQRSEFTLGQVLTSLEFTAAKINFGQTDLSAMTKLDSLIVVLHASPAEHFTVKQIAAIVVQNGRSGVGTVARWNPEAYEIWVAPGFTGALAALRQIANTPLTRALKAAHLTDTEIDSLMAPVDALETAIREAAKSANQEKLRRYEIKYGPESPRLNAAEVGLNYLAQFIPLFGPSSEGWPSPYELVASYSTSDLTLARATTGQTRCRITSSTRIGVRHYQFQPGWGTGGRIARFLKPSEASIGTFLLAPQDAPFGRTWGRGTRIGTYVSWGTLHVGFAGGSQRRWAVGTGKQIIPYAF